MSIAVGRHQLAQRAVGLETKWHPVARGVLHRDLDVLQVVRLAVVRHFEFVLSINLIFFVEFCNREIFINFRFVLNFDQ